MNRSTFVSTLAGALVAFVVFGGPVRGQVGQGLMDFNTATAEQLAALPHMSAAAVKAVTDGRPFMSIVDLHKALLAAGVTAEQTTELYAKAFVHVNLNTGTPEEILLIPGAGRRMVREFKEYRPWTSQAQFEKEIGKYVDAKEVARLWRYVVIK